MIDLIGDIHGYADKLEGLLGKMGYTNKNGFYSHPDRKVVFVGDYIDRGPQIRETLQLVKAMVDSDAAIALMGNHEYNALCFHFEEKDKGGHLRKHLIKNILQHCETLSQFKNRQEEYESYLEWFKTLPLLYETDSFRAVHACWDMEHIAYLQSALANYHLTDDLIYDSVRKGSKLNEAIEIVLKGREMQMPPSLSFTDKDGIVRKEIRIKWWDNPANETYRSISVEPLDILPDTPVNVDQANAGTYYFEDQKPVFFGHYWLKGEPFLYRNNICCLDYSVAKQGYLASYRFDGERQLDPSKLVYV